MKQLRVIFYVLLLLTSIRLDASSTDSLWKDYSAINEKDRQIQALKQIAINYSLENEFSKKDSTIDIMIDIARSSMDEEKLINSYNFYFNNFESTNINKALARANEMLVIAKKNNNNEWFYEAYSALSITYQSLDEPAKALEQINNAYYYVSLVPNDTLKAVCMIQYGECQEQNNKKIEAFRNYINALYLSQKTNNKLLIYNSYQYLSTFYRLIKKYPEAKEYKQKQLAILLEKQPVDSNKLMHLYVDVSGILYDNDERNEAEKITKQVLNYAYRHKNYALIQPTLIRYNSYLIEHNYFQDLANVYVIEYPEELSKLAKFDTIYFYRIKAYIAEVKGYMDSSLYYYKMAEEKIDGPQYDYIYQSNFLKRYGQFLLRKGDIAAAIPKMEQSYEYAKKANYLPYLVETTQYLDSLNYKQGTLAKAYEYSRLNNEYEKQQAAINKDDEILRMEIDNEARQKEMDIEKQKADTERRHHLQYMAISLLLGLSLMALVMLGAFKVHPLLIKSVGFFSFIFLFEFIVLLADNKIHEATHGEPWKVLSIKIVLIAILFPLHHWLEEKAIHYLTTHRFIDPAKFGLKVLVKKKKIDPPAVKDNV